ncbi:MAG: phosphodiester glycosidase family protein [Clostridia bacterium]|nr:phosphodiester glycosidase family protein [Clostridia bacterium]
MAEKTGAVPGGKSTSGSAKKTEKGMTRGTKRKISRVLSRVLLSFLLVILLVFLLIWTLIFAVAHGPSKSMRNLLVGAAMQASATKFVPYLVLSPDKVSEIMAEAAVENVEVYSPTEFSSRFIKKIVTDSNGNRYEITVLANDDGTALITDSDGSTQLVEYNEWDYAIDGIQFITVNRANFKAYMLIIRDPSRVYTATSSDFSDSSVSGKRFYEMAEQENCVALINGGEFSDPGGQGNGGAPQGLTFSKGKCVWDDGTSWKTFIGFDSNNRMVISEGLTSASAKAAGIRDGVCFRPTTKSSSSRLIYTDAKGSVHVSNYNTSSPAQRSAIGQRADGAVIFITTDGRSASSLGASYNDMTQLMYEYGAVNAGMLDGGSSAVLYYRDYFKLYEYDESRLDQYQKMGLVNKYVAATAPRHIPTFFCVAPSK